LRNRYHRYNRLKKEKILLEKIRRENYLQQLSKDCYIAFPLFTGLSANEQILLRSFVEQNKTEIILENGFLISMLPPVSVANIINSKLYPYWYITINTTATHTILTISPQFFDILCKYYLG
jgi:hypothetical protein